MRFRPLNKYVVINNEHIYYQNRSGLSEYVKVIDRLTYFRRIFSFSNPEKEKILVWSFQG